MADNIYQNLGKSPNPTNLEVLAKIGENVFDFFKDITKNYIGEQLTTTFNVPGYRVAKKHLNTDLGPDSLSSFLGTMAGLSQDLLIINCAIYHLTRPHPWDIPNELSHAITIGAGIAGIKIATNICAFAGPKLFGVYKSAKQSLKNKKES